MPSAAAKLASRKKKQQMRRQQHSFHEDSYYQLYQQHSPPHQQPQQQSLQYQYHPPQPQPQQYHHAPPQYQHEQPRGRAPPSSHGRVHESDPSFHLNARAAAGSPVAPVESDPDGERQWQLLQSSLLLDGMGRLQHLREQQQQHDSPRRGGGTAQQQPRSDSLQSKLAEEWLQVSEDALLMQLSRTPFFSCPSTPRGNNAPPARQVTAPEAALARWARTVRAQNQARGFGPPSLPPPHLFAASSGGVSSEVSPEQIFASATLQALQEPPHISGINTAEMQEALQLTLQQMSSRIHLGLIQPPVRSSALSIDRHPFLRLLDELSERRVEEPPSVAPTAAAKSASASSLSSSSADLSLKLRRAYCATMIQRAYRRLRSRRAARKALRERVASRAEAAARVRRERDQHAIRVLQASIRTRVALHSFRAAQARSTALDRAGRRIAKWWSWRARVRRWDNAWKKTAQTRSLMFQRLTPQQLSCIILLQSAFRSFLCRKHVLPYVRAMRAHRDRRLLVSYWSHAHLPRTARSGPLEESLVLADLYAFRERQGALDESRAERTNMNNKFAAWEQDMRNYFLRQRPLPKHWLPQADRHSGHTYYFNLKTGAISQQHPYAAAVQQLHAQEQAAAEKTLAQRLSVLRDFQTTLQERVDQQRQNGVRELIQVR